MQFQRDIAAIDRLNSQLERYASELTPLPLRPRDETANAGSQRGANTRTLQALFAANPQRAADFSAGLGELYLDYSKSLLDERSLEALCQLAAASGMRPAIESLMAGAELNHTERRAALHTRLREPAGLASPQRESIERSKAALRDFVEAVREGDWRGFDGRRIDTVINLGIGGSDLGPAMVVDALAGSEAAGLMLSFVSNVDPSHLARALRGRDPATTLFVVASKTFTTQETLANAEAARAWLLTAAGGDTSAVAKHFVAVSANVDSARAFGIDPSNIFTLWDWVGGRFSLWSAIGLPIALAQGFERFEELLAGAHEMDRHFASAEPRQNLPLLLALLSYWYRRYFGAASTAVIPYSQDLVLFPAYLQQLYMESLGKSVDREGQPIAAATSEVIWGSAGTNGQHSFFQQLHQGTEFTPVEFIACALASADDPEDSRHHSLLANCLSQAMALMRGDDSTDPHRRIAGDRPSTTLLLKRLSPHNLGALIALFEHRVFALSVLWNVNAFDQWGVELGKRLTQDVLPALRASADNEVALDGSTAALVEKIREWRGER